MKTNRKVLALLTTLAMVFTMMVATSLTAFAAGEGSITIKNATKGYEYEAYKVFDATYKGDNVSYTTPAANASKLDDSIFGHSTAADADGNISVWVKDGVDDATVTAWIEAHYADFGGTKITGAFDETNSTYTFSNLDYGYYFIKSTLGAVVTIDSAAPTATVYDKNETTPTAPVKKIVSVDGVAAAEVTEANAHVGSVVGFKVTANTNNWIDKDIIRKEFVIEDTPTNVTIDQASIAVKVNGTTIAATAYSVAVADGKLKITIPMVDADNNSVYEANHGESAGLIPVEVTYTGTIDEAAATGGAKNTVGDSVVKIYTYKFDLKKVDDKGEELLGAKFQLKKGNTVVKFDQEGTTYTYNENGTVDTIDLTQSATATIQGLDNLQDYTLVETVVPGGYNQAEDETVDKSKLVKVGEGVDGGEYLVEVENKAGSVLPSTGGIGTTIFYILGSLLVVGCGIVLVSRKRMQNNK